MTTIQLISRCGMLLTILVLASAGVQATTVSVRATLTNPTCTLTVPAAHNIGSIQVGTEASYKSLTIAVNCNNGTVASRLYATVLSGTQVDENTIRMNGTGSATSLSPPRLKMLEGSSSIALDGSGASSNAGAFCVGSTTRNCVLTPQVNVPSDAAAGSAKASLRFTLRYS